MRPTLSDLGRFAEPSLLILVSLSDGPKHGYAIMTDVEAGTGRPMGAGTLYAALVRLEERGIIEALGPIDRRRPYRLTALGATRPGRAAPRSRGLREPAQRLRTPRRPGRRMIPLPPPPLSGALARPLRRRVRADPPGSAARTVRRGGRPARRARCPPPPPRPRGRLGTPKGVRHVTEDRRAMPRSSAASSGSSPSPATRSTTAPSRAPPGSATRSSARRDDARRPHRPQRLPGPPPPGRSSGHRSPSRRRGRGRPVRLRGDRGTGDSDAS